MPEDVEDCVRSIQADNPDMDEDTARAVCNDMKNRGVLEAFNEADPHDGPAELAALASFQDVGRIQRVETGAGVRYRNVMLLAPGAWTDAGSRSTAIYDPDAIRSSADNWVDPETREPVEQAEINLLHGPALHQAATMGDVGHIPTDAITVDEDGQLYGDLVMHQENAASELAVELVDEALEAADDPARETPPVGPSVEIVDERGQHDPDKGVKRLEEMWFSGLGIVFNPASRTVELSKQVKERAVAMAEDLGYDTAGLVVRHHDGPEGGAGAAGATQSLKSSLRHRRVMADGDTDTDEIDFDELSDEDLEMALQAMREDMSEIQRALQDDGDMAAVFDLTTQFQQDGNDMQAPVTEFVEWVEQNTDVGADALQDILDAYLEAVEAESLEATPVEGLQDWLREQGAAGEDEGEEGDGDGEAEEEGEGQPSMEDLQAAVDTISAFKGELESVKEMLAEYREETEEQMEEVERRLQKVAEEPQRRSLTEGKDSEFHPELDSESGDTEHEDVML